jgi:hypothetical protein
MCCALILFTRPAMNAQINDIKIKSKENKSNHSDNNSSNGISSDSNNDNSECIGGCLNALFSDLLSELFSGCLGSFGSSKTNENNNSFIVVQDSTHASRSHGVSFDINANFAIGFEYSSKKTYNYYIFLPELRLNLSWFLVDFRYNMLTEFSQDLPDALKTWDLEFLLNIRANQNTNIILGSGMHKEQLNSLLFNEHYLGLRSKLNDKEDYLEINGRLAIDYQTSAIPFSEFGVHYNKRFINSNNLSAFFNIGGIYQNYYSSTDIWAFQAGILLKLH